MPRRHRLLVPSKISAPLRRLTFTPFSFCRLPTGTTTLELVVSGRSVAIGSLGCVQSLAAAAGTACQARITTTPDSHSDLGYFMYSFRPYTHRTRNTTRNAGA